MKLNTDKDFLLQRISISQVNSLATNYTLSEHYNFIMILLPKKNDDTNNKGQPNISE